MSDQSQHDAAMATKVDEASAATAAAASSPVGGVPPAAQPAPATRPADVPEKFWDAATGQVNTKALLQSYTELERAKSEPPKPADGAPAADPAAAAVASAGLNMAELSQEFATTGVLSEASYAALAKAGFDKNTVDSHIAGQQALANQRDSAGYELAGGKDQFAAMATWAGTSMSAPDLAQFNAAVNGTEAQMKQAITALRAQYEAANGRDPKLLSGSNAGDMSGEHPFESRAQVTEAMRNPKYKADPAYRAMVERRVGLMPVF